jgi:biotin synthase
MITHPKAAKDTLKVVSEIKKRTDKEISTLISPSVVNESWLRELKASGSGKIGIAIDAVTEELFDKVRGKGVKGPHRWKKYWDIIEHSLNIFGPYDTVVHLIVGLDETEKQMSEMIQKCIDKQLPVQLFSFFPENGSKEEMRKQPPIGQYRRIQLARYLIEKEITREENFLYNENGQITDFGMDITEYVEIGKPFMTSGCEGKTVEVACNRPFGNCAPYQALNGEWRNFPILPEKSDIDIIKKQLKDYSMEGTIPGKRVKVSC